VRKKRRKKRIITKTLKIGVIIAIVAVAAYVAVSFASQNFSPQQNTQSTTELSKHAPLFTTSDINGTQVSLNDFRGRIVVLYFMKTLYDAQLDEILEIWPSYCGKNVVLISMLDPACECTRTDLLTQRQARQMTWFVVIDAGYAIFPLYSKYIVSHGEPYLPTIILIDENLDIARVYGFVPASTLSLEIEGLINK